MKKISLINIAVACVCSFFLCTCSKAPGSGSPDDLNANVAMRVKDAPTALCQNARIEIKGIKVFTSGQGWVSVPMNDTIMDILQLQDTSALMGNLHLNIGTISQVQVTLGTDDTVTVGGINFLLTVTATTFTVPVNFALTASGNFVLVLDINAAQSIWDADNDGIHHNYNMTSSGTCTFGKQG
jgi:hypothetical protein